MEMNVKVAHMQYHLRLHTESDPPTSTQSLLIIAMTKSMEYGSTKFRELTNSSDNN